jgi:3-hydroxyisobutyrate dehydrogenase-like beta-hydroxyacid dehydrogenase
MKVAVVGLGLMGTAIAERLLAAGHEVAVYNRTAGKAAALVGQGAVEVTECGAIWNSADVAVTMVADSSALEAVTIVAGGLVSESARGKTLIDMSTVSADSSARVASAAAEVGLAFLRAPVSGNPVVVRSGNLGIMVSGDPEVFASADALLRDIGPNIFYLGPGEVARVMKLALNLMVAGTAQMLAEALTLGEAHGLERAEMLDVIAGSAVGSPFVKYKSAALVNNDYSSTFTTRLMRKDLDIALATAAEAGVPLPTTALIQQLLQGCISAGMADIDFMALLPRLQREAGHEIAVLVSV